jgi:cellulose synthase/poly-beta-1,6-N-acetylglucosamine synthase-like glycosyltransferase
MKALAAVLAVFLTYLVLAALLGLSLSEAYVLGLSLFFLFQGTFAIRAMLYTWEGVDNLSKIFPPKLVFGKPKRGFSLIVPARHEEKVIGDTLASMARIDYPAELLEVLVIVRKDDEKTIKAVEDTLSLIKRDNFRLITFDGYPINKAHSLNIGLSHAQHGTIGVFDAEDEPDPDILKSVDLAMTYQKADVVQGGVQLVNVSSTWFSAFNCLEYYFWFKSVLPFFSRLGSTPLGGNTTFFKKQALSSVGGWDEDCLTEDGEIGLRLSVAGCKVGIIYDEKMSTLEETPPDTESFIRQRSRWDQGYLQILFKGDWLKLPSFSKQFLALYLFLQPAVHVLTTFNLLALPFFALSAHVPVGLALFSFVPSYTLLLHLGLSFLGLLDLCQRYKLPSSFKLFFKTLIFFFPYQIVLGYAFFRAALRLVTGVKTWEKTVHVNAHRVAVDVVKTKN